MSLALVICGIAALATAALVALFLPDARSAAPDHPAPEGGPSPVVAPREADDGQ